MLITRDLVALRQRARRDVSIEIVHPDRLEIDLDGLMDFGAASRLLAYGQRAARRFLELRKPAETASARV